MTLIVILSALAIQRFLGYCSSTNRLDWVSHYFKWMFGKCQWIAESHGLIGFALLILPIVFLTAVIFGIIYAAFGFLAYWLLNLLLFWYCVDGRNLRKMSHSASSAMMLQNAYESLFAIVFWYALFGPVGLSLYFSTSQINKVLFQPLRLTAGGETSGNDGGERKEVCEERDYRALTDSSMQSFFLKVQNGMDWVPVRLLGLTFALVADFSAVFKLWVDKLFDQKMQTKALLVVWGEASLQSEVPAEGKLLPTISLIEKALLVWLIVIFLVTLGFLS